MASDALSMCVSFALVCVRHVLASGMECVSELSQSISCLHHAKINESFCSLLLSANSVCLLICQHSAFCARPGILPHGVQFWLAGQYPMLPPESMALQAVPYAWISHMKDYSWPHKHRRLQELAGNAFTMVRMSSSAKF